MADISKIIKSDSFKYSVICTQDFIPTEQETGEIEELLNNFDGEGLLDAYLSSKLKDSRFEFSPSVFLSKRDVESLQLNKEEPESPFAIQVKQVTDNFTNTIKNSVSGFLSSFGIGGGDDKEKESDDKQGQQTKISLKKEFQQLQETQESQGPQGTQQLQGTQGAQGPQGTQQLKGTQGPQGKTETPQQQIEVRQTPPPYTQKLEEVSMEGVEKEEKPPISQELPKQEKSPEVVKEARESSPQINVNVSVPETKVPPVEREAQEKIQVVNPSIQNVFPSTKESTTKERVSEKGTNVQNVLTTSSVDKLRESVLSNISTTVNKISADQKISNDLLKETTKEVFEKSKERVKTSPTSQKITESNQVQSQSSATSVDRQSSQSVNLLTDTITQTTDNLQSVTSELSRNVEDLKTISTNKDNFVSSSTDKVIDNQENVESISSDSSVKNENTSDFERQIEQIGGSLYETLNNTIGGIFNSLGIGDVVSNTNENKNQDSIVYNTNATNVSTESTPVKSEYYQKFSDKVVEQETIPTENIMAKEVSSSVSDAIKTLVTTKDFMGIIPPNPTSMPLSGGVSAPQQINLNNPPPGATNTSTSGDNTSNEISLNNVDSGRNQFPTIIDLSHSTITKLASEIVKSMSITSFLHKGT